MTLIEKLRTIEPGLAREVEELAAELASTAAALDDAKRVRSSFLQNISHEVRTPITVMRGLLDILAEDVGLALTDSQRDLIDRVRHSSQQVLDLIQGLLDLSKAEAGMVETRRFAIYFPDLVADLVRGVEPTLAKKGVQLLIDVPRGIDWLTVDGTLLKQVVGHLLSNAAKFTAHGHVRLAARLLGRSAGGAVGGARLLRAPEPAGDTLEICVEDTGEGIPPAEQERIFEAFRQVDGSMARRHEGLGVGLASVREVSKSLRASIDLQSRPGEGTSVRLLVPLLAVESPAKALATPPAPARIPAARSLDSRGVLSDLASLSLVSPASDAEAIAFTIDFIDRLLRPEVCFYSQRSAGGEETVVEVLGHGPHGLAPGRPSPLSAGTLKRLSVERQALSESADSTEAASWVAIGVFSGRTEPAGTLAVRLLSRGEGDEDARKIVQIAGGWLGRELERGRLLRERGEIVATIGRDLKTPLGALLAHTQTLLRGLAGPLAPDQRRAVLELERTIHRAILSALDLLDYQRMTGRGIEIERRPFSFQEVIAHVLSRQSAAVELAGAIIDQQLSSDLSRCSGDLVRTDRALSIVLRALLERLEASRPITLRAFMEGGLVCLEVSAAPTDVAPFIEAFGSKVAPVELGETLGLRIARGWMEAQGGRLHIRRDAGGIAIRFELLREAG